MEETIWRGTSAAERREERRQRLIEAAIEVYGELGYREGGVRAICRAAGLTERYFYESFANGEALLAAAFDREVEALVKAVRAADPGPGYDSATRARAQLTVYYGGIRLRPNSTRLFIVELPAASAEMEALFTQSLWRLSDLIFETHDPDRTGPLGMDPLLLRGVAGGLLHIALQWLTDGFAQTTEAVVDAALPLVMLATRS